MKKSLLAILLALFAIPVFSQSVLKAVQVNVFKNGTYFIAKEGNVNVKKSTSIIELPDNALLGTYWLSTSKDNKITKVSFQNDTIKKTKTPQNFNDIFKGTVGKKVHFTYAPGDGKTVKEISGTLVGFYETSNIAKIKLNDSKITYFPVSSMVEFTIEDADAGLLSVDSLVRVGKVTFEKQANAADLRLVYMQSGIQWFPSYLVRILNDNEVQLEMKALVENYAEDIENADLTLTVGNPQFYYESSIDPICQDYLTYLYDKTSGISTRVPIQAQSYMNSNSFVSTDFISDESSFYPVSEYATDGEKTNDLYMYKLGNVSISKRSKTSFQIFSAKISYKDVYEVNLNDVVRYANNSYIGNDPEKRFDVYHSIKLNNTTTFPFTTASAFILNENQQPLAQDRLKYTPVNASVSLQLSKAGDVVVKNKEEEVSKEDNVKKIGKTYYNKVTIKGSIQIENLQAKKILLSIKKNLFAKITEVSDNGKYEKSGKYSGLNPSTDINWEISFGAGESKTITYVYEVYVPNSGY